MATSSKYTYNPAYFENLLPILREAIPGFDSREFIFRIFNNEWPDLEFRQRVRHISLVLHHFVSKDFSIASQQIVAISRRLKSQAESDQNFGNMCLADYIEDFRFGNSDESLTVGHIRTSPSFKATNLSGAT